MMRGLLVGIALTATCHHAQGAAPPMVLAESFESDSPGWKLVLNRGAQAEMAPCDDGLLGARSIKVTPHLLCAPDDREGSTNIHLRYEEIELRAGVRYVMSAWMRSSGNRPVGLRVRRNSVEESVGGGRMALGPQWRRCEFAFTLPTDYPDGVPQILLGDSLLPVWIDAVTVAEAPAEDLAPADYVAFSEQATGARAALVRFATDFEDEAGPWQLQLNRGAQAEMVLEEGCLRIAPSALCAPTNQAYATNVHIRASTVSLRAGREYVFSARLRSDGPRTAGFRLRGADGRGALSGPEFEVGEAWRRYEWRFTPEEDLDAVVPQVLAGQDLRPLWVDDVVLAEAGAEEESPEGCIARGGLWLRPEAAALPAEGAGPLAGLTELAADLPASVRIHLAVDMFGAPGLRLVLGSDAPALTVEITDRAVTIGGDSHDLPSEGWRAGEPVTLTLERLDDRATLTIGETARVELPTADFTRAWLSATAPGRAVHVIAAEGYEMLPAHRADGATEREEYRDPVTGRRIVRLTHSPFNDKHAYYDISPWSPDGSLIAFSSALPGERAATLNIMNADGTNIRKLADAYGFSMHTGVFNAWAPDGESIYFNTSWTDEAGERHSGVSRVWLADGRIERYDVNMRQVSRANGRLLWMENGRGEGAPERGLYSAAPDGSDVRLLCRTADIEALSPTRAMHGQCAGIGLTNCKWSPDGTKVMVVLVGYDAGGAQLVKEIYIANADGSDLHFVMTFAHHHIWHPNSRQVIGNCADGLYIVNADGTGRRKLCDLAQGHPSFSPDGSMIVTDCYGGEFADMLVLIDPETGEVTPLCSVPTVHGRSHETGTHPHPCWAPDGRSILYDSDQEGHCQLYRVFLD